MSTWDPRDRYDSSNETVQPPFKDRHVITHEPSHGATPPRLRLVRDYCGSPRRLDQIGTPANLLPVISHFQQKVIHPVVPAPVGAHQGAYVEQSSSHPVLAVSSLDHTQSTTTTATSTVNDLRPYQQSVYPERWCSFREDGEAPLLHGTAATLPVSGRMYTLEMWDKLPNSSGDEKSSTSSQEGCGEPETSGTPTTTASDEFQNVTGGELTSDKANSNLPEPTDGLEQGNLESNTCNSPAVAAADGLYYGFTASEIEGSVEPDDALLKLLGESGFDFSVFEPSNARTVDVGAPSELPDIANTEDDLQVLQEQEYNNPH